MIMELFQFPTFKFNISRISKSSTLTPVISTLQSSPGLLVSARVYGIPTAKALAIYT